MKNAKLTQPDVVELSNGIPVVFLNLPGAVAATYWWNQVGSTDEGPKEAGFAHFLEHMLFKDAAAKETGKPSSGQTARAIESLGGDINAYTSFDQTVYHVTCASQHWESIIDVFGPIAKPQKFLKTDFEREREVILEELAKNDDSPGRRLYQNLFDATFERHPYGRPVIGFERTLKAANVQMLEAFYRRCYVSSNMGLILVGPLDETRKKSLLKRLERYYGASVIKRAPAGVQNRTRVVENPIRKQATVRKLAFDVKAPLTAFAFRVPELKHSDTPALDLAAGVLGMGELSWLYQKLFYQTSLVTDVSGALFVPKDPGLFYFQIEVEKTEKLKIATEALFEELRRFTIDGPNAEEIDRVLVNLESERLYATQTADGMASRMGFLKYIVGDLYYDRAYLDKLRALSPEDVKKTFKQYFDSRRLALSLVVPKAEKAYNEKELIQKAVSIIEKSSGPVTRFPKRSSKLSSEKHPEWDLQPERIIRPNGMRVLFLERPQSPVVSVHASVLGGLRLEGSEPWGASHLMGETWTKGSGSGDRYKDGTAISKLIEGAAASLDGFAGRNTVGLHLTALARDWGRLGELFSEVLWEPHFAETEIEHSKRVVEDSLRTLEDQSTQLCSKLFLETLYDRHPYGKLLYGSLESLPLIHTDPLKRLHQRWVRPENLVLSVSGGIRRTDLDRWLDQMDRIIEVLPRREAYRLPSVEAEHALKAPRWVDRKFGREQVHIIVGGLGISIHSPERFQVRMLQNLLGGQSGRLFIELREKQSLGYSVAPIGFEGLEPGYLGTYIGCSPGKQQAAIDGIRKVLEQLAKKVPSASELRRAQQYYLGKRAMDLQSDTALSAHFGLEELYGVPRLTESEVSQQVLRVTPQQVQKTCEKYLVQPFMVTAQVG